MKPHDFEDIYQRYLSVPPVQRWLNKREPVGRLGEYLRVEDPMLLGLGLLRPSERGVKSPQVGDLYLVHSISQGFALGITLAQQVETYELVGTVQSVCSLKMPGQALDYSDKIIVRRFAVDLERASKALELLEYSWLEDGGLVTQAKFTVVRQFPFPMTSHSEHRFWRPPDSVNDMPSSIYARMVLREMSAPRCDGDPALQEAPCKFCMVYGRKTCCCPSTFRNRLRDEKTPIKCVRVLTGGTWSGYKGVFERAQLAGVVSVRWILGDWKGAEREVITSTLPYKCHVGSPQEIGSLLRKFCLWTGQYREAPHIDNRYLESPEGEEFKSISTFLLPAPVSDICVGGSKVNEDSAESTREPERLVPMHARLPPVPTLLPPSSVVGSSLGSGRSLRVDDSLSHAKNYSIATIDSRPRRITLSTCATDSQGMANVSSTNLPVIPQYVGDTISHRTVISSGRENVFGHIGHYKTMLHGSVAKRRRACSPGKAVRLSPLTVSPNPSCGTGIPSEVGEGASHLMFLRTGTSSVRSHRSSYEGSANVVGSSTQQTYSSTGDGISAAHIKNEQTSGLAASGEELASRAIVDGRGKQANWTCHLCGATFKGKRGNLNRHYQVVHAKEKRFVCEYPGCGQRFGYRLNQQRHYQNVHESRKYKCVQCGEGFKTFQKMDIHVKIVHEKLKKPFICPICPDTAFGRKSSLTRHMSNLHKGAMNNLGHPAAKDEAFSHFNGGMPPLKVCM